MEVDETWKIRKRSVYAGRMRLLAVSERTGELVTTSVEPGSTVVTDGFAGYDTLPGLGYSHRPVIVDKDYDKAEEFLPMVHLVFSNLKAWLMGTTVSAPGLPERVRIPVQPQVLPHDELQLGAGYRRANGGADIRKSVRRFLGTPERGGRRLTCFNRIGMV